MKRMLKCLLLVLAVLAYPGLALADHGFTGGDYVDDVYCPNNLASERCQNFIIAPPGTGFPGYNPPLHKPYYGDFGLGGKVDGERTYRYDPRLGTDPRYGGFQGHRPFRPLSPRRR